MLSTLQLKNLQKTEKRQVQRFRTFAFKHKLPSKLFSKLPPITKFGFTLFQRLCLAFQKIGFNFVTPKLAIKWKMSFPDTQNICF